MRRIAAAYLSCVVLTACGGGSVSSPSTAPVGSSSPAPATPTTSLPQLAQAFAAINVTANAALTAASKQLQAATTIDQAKAAVSSALAAYLAFDSGLQGLHLPASLQADVTSQFHADSKVEADYQNAETDPSFGQMQATLSTVGDDSNTAGAATIVLRRDLGLPPTS